MIFLSTLPLLMGILQPADAYLFLYIFITPFFPFHCNQLTISLLNNNQVVKAIDRVCEVLYTIIP